jgi:hypothetical protein
VNVRYCRRRGRCSGAAAVLAAVPGGSVAYVPGAVTGIGSEAVIDGTSLSGAVSQDRFAVSSAPQGARRGPGAEIRERPGRATHGDFLTATDIKGARRARDHFSASVRG